MYIKLSTFYSENFELNALYRKWECLRVGQGGFWESCFGVWFCVDVFGCLRILYVKRVV